MKNGNFIVLPFLTLSVMLLTGCSTIVNAHRQKQDLMHNYIAGAREQALEELEFKLRPSTALNSSRTDTGDEIMWRLEAGSLNLVTGHDDRSIRHFSRAEELIEDFDERALLNLREAGEWANFSFKSEKDGKFDITLKRGKYRVEWPLRALVLIDGIYVGDFIAKENAETAVIKGVKLSAGNHRLTLISACAYGVWPTALEFKKQ